MRPLEKTGRRRCDDGLTACRPSECWLSTRMTLRPSLPPAMRSDAARCGADNADVGRQAAAPGYFAGRATINRFRCSRSGQFGLLLGSSARAFYPKAAFSCREKHYTVVQREKKRHFMSKELSQRFAKDDSGRRIALDTLDNMRTLHFRRVRPAVFRPPRRGMDTVRQVVAKKAINHL